jgi:REP element-mobilizing transposase RayT
MVVRRRLSLNGPAMVFVTTTVRNWVPVFADERCAHAVLLQFRKTTAHFQSGVAAYVLMPSHLHALLGVRDVERLSEIMQTFKSLSARQVRPLLPPHFEAVFHQRSGLVLETTFR